MEQLLHLRRLQHQLTESHDNKKKKKKKKDVSRTVAEKMETEWKRPPLCMRERV
jgi:hypothetical protein